MTFPNQERRVDHRQRLLQSGSISPDGYSSVYDCIVKNYHQRGARITVVSALGIPQKFQFRFPHDDLVCDAEVKWRDENTMGIAFSKI